MNDDTVTIITGLLNDIFVPRLIYSYRNIKNKILSTWKDQDPTLLSDLSENGFIIILNKYPEHKCSMNYQITLTKTALDYALQEQFSYVCHMRTDVFPSDHIKFLDVTRELYTEKLTVLCGIHTNIIYFLDIITIGHIYTLLKFYGTLQKKNDERPVELFLLENYNEVANLTREQIKINMHFCLETCQKNRVEFVWYRDSNWRVGNRTIPNMRVISEYCSEEFIFL
jgi:hypothetical protein